MIVTTCTSEVNLVQLQTVRPRKQFYSKYSIRSIQQYSYILPAVVIVGRPVSSKTCRLYGYSILHAELELRSENARAYLKLACNFRARGAFRPTARSHRHACYVFMCCSRASWLSLPWLYMTMDNRHHSIDTHTTYTYRYTMCINLPMYNIY